MSHYLRMGGFEILGDDRPHQGKLKAWFKSFQTSLCQVKSVSRKPEVVELFPTLHLPKHSRGYESYHSISLWITRSLHCFTFNL